MRIARLVVVGLSLLAVAACSYHPYDPNKPEEYVRYWCKPENYTNTLVGRLNSQERANYDQSCRENIRTDNR